MIWETRYSTGNHSNPILNAALEIFLSKKKEKHILVESFTRELVKK